MMFGKDCTSSIIDFVNSTHRANKIEEYKELVKAAISELDKRVPLIAKCYSL